MDETALLDWTSGDRKLVGRFRGVGALLTISKQSDHMLVHQFVTRPLNAYVVLFYLNSYCCLSY